MDSDKENEQPDRQQDQCAPFEANDPLDWENYRVLCTEIVAGRANTFHAGKDNTYIVRGIDLRIMPISSHLRNFMVCFVLSITPNPNNGK